MDLVSINVSHHRDDHCTYVSIGGIDDHGIHHYLREVVVVYCNDFSHFSSNVNAIIYSEVNFYPVSSNTANVILSLTVVNY